MNKLLGIVLILAGLAGCIFGISMTVMAVRYHEWGRVLFYGMISVISFEIMIFGILKLKKKS